MRTPGPPLKGKGDEIAQQRLISAAWFEWRTCLRSIGLEDSGPTPSPDDFEVRPPRWFILLELGYHVEHGPDLRRTCSQLARMNRDALLALDPDDAPDKVTYPRDFIDPRSLTRGPRTRREATATPRGRRRSRGSTVASPEATI